MRHEIRARLSEPSWRAWDRLVTAEGVTMTALCEALGLELHEGRWRPTERVLARARRIDRDRRSR